MLWPVILPSLEVGTWIGWAMARFGSRDRVRAKLIHGTRAAKPVPMLDKQLVRETSGATAMQKKAAAGITRGVRFLAGFHAFELVVLKLLQDNWPGSKRAMEVQIHL